MVKNEQDAIVPTLESYLPAELTVGKYDPEDVAFVVYDTGSTDQTVQRARQFFEDRRVLNYKIVREEHPTPFHYANGRNRALEIAQEAYPESTFLLFPDAEWYMDNMDKLISFCKEEVRTFECGTMPPSHYKIMLLSTAGNIMPQSRLFLTKNDIYFVGKKHEVPNEHTDAWVPHSIFMEYRTTRYGAEKSRDRWYNDRNDFIKELEEDPHNSRALYYLGRTEQWLGHNHIAYTYLKKRAAITIFPEEDFAAFYNLGIATELLSYEDPTNYQWEEACGYYMKAYTMRPHRAEPLIRIAEYYLNEKQYETSYLFAKRATELPLPDIKAELLPLFMEDYTFYRWEVLSRCAWYVGDFILGEKAAKQAIEGHPNTPYLYSNLASYWDK